MINIFTPLSQAQGAFQLGIRNYELGIKQLNANLKIRQFILDKIHIFLAVRFQFSIFNSQLITQRATEFLFSYLSNKENHRDFSELEMKDLARKNSSFIVHNSSLNKENPVHPVRKRLFHFLISQFSHFYISPFKTFSTVNFQLSVKEVLAKEISRSEKSFSIEKSHRFFSRIFAGIFNHIENRLGNLNMRQFDNQKNIFSFSNHQILIVHCQLSVVN